MAGADGPTHHGAFDLAYFRCIPNMIVAAPMNEEELRNMMYTAQLPDMGPFSIRYPRGNGVMSDWRKPFKALQVGQGRKLKDGKDIAILTIGHIGNIAAEAVNKLLENGVSAAHYDMRFVKPIDEVMLHEIFGKFDRVITVEDACIQGGFGSAVIEFMADNGYAALVKRLGIPDRWIEHGEQKELYDECGYGLTGITETALEMVAVRSGTMAG
jgi:1-deoxy-D-xylulose-5-phosphate synthase